MNYEERNEEFSSNDNRREEYNNYEERRNNNQLNISLNNNIHSIIGLLCAFSGINIIGLILSIKGIKIAKKTNGENLSLAISGTIISIIHIIRKILIIIFMFILPVLRGEITVSNAMNNVFLLLI